ncbi:MAG: bifunctional oligoribonuclease/PAP phosphatase NrnA [Paludibacteraceae bacterium]|nr:bifunctional oligoribonuclease/PAP phosphatase NrnA [Paludibacteraceae bacterium]
MLSKVIPEEKIIATLKAINKADKIVIVTHKSPDGDAIGSSLGLYHFLYSQEKATDIVVPDTIPDYLKGLPSVSEIAVHSEDPERAEKLVAEAQLLFCLDFNTPSRTGALAQLVTQSGARKILIDHHTDPDNFADVCISHPELCSTSELIFRLICRMGYFSEMTLESAHCICAGILTDTGGLAYNSNSPKLYTIMGELLGKGVDKDLLYRQLFNTYSEQRMRLMGYFLSQKMEVLPEYQTAVTAMSAEELRRFNYQPGDIEGFVNLPLSISGIRFSVFMREHNDSIKISLRSVGDIPCNRIAAELFNGGGHKNASGGESQLGLEETKQILIQALPRYFKH